MHFQNLAISYQIWFAYKADETRVLIIFDEPQVGSMCLSFAIQVLMDVISAYVLELLCMSCTLPKNKLT